MIPSSIQYRYTMLLLWATIALVANPVLHAIGHCAADCHDHETEVVSLIEWTDHERCPYCDAISQFVESSPTKASFTLNDLHEEAATFFILYPDLRLRLSTRLRAPPGLA